MNKVDVLYKNYNVQPSGFKDLLKNCDLSLFTTDEKFSKLLTKASLTNYAIRKQRQHERESKVELIKNVFKKHPRNFADEDLVSTDSRESITNDHILRTKFQRHKKSFEQIRKLLPKHSNDEHLYENPSNIKKMKKQLSNESINMAENNNNVDGVDKVTNFKEQIVENGKIKKQMSDESLASLEKSLIDVSKLKKSREKEKVDEHVQTLKTTNIIHNITSTTDDFLGVNLSSILLKISGWLGELSTVIHEGILPIDGAEDYLVRETRCREFGTRFCRQYDYEFSRLLGTLRTYMPRVSNRLNVNRIAQNITKSSQIILQAIMQYCSHVPTTMISIEQKQYNVHVKFQHMLKNILEFFVIIKKLGKTFVDVRNSFDTVEEIDKRCNCIMILIEEKLMRPTPAAPKCQQKVAKKIVPSKENKNKKSPYQSSYQNQSIEKRLSMYSMSFKNRTGKSLGPKRINVQSRYKTAGIVKVPVSDNTADQEKEKEKEKEKKDTEKKKLLPQKRSSQIVFDDSCSTFDPPRINEDEIETMVEKVAKTTYNNHLQLHPHNRELRNKVAILLQSWTDISNGKMEDVTNNKEMIVTKMLNLFQHLQDGSQKLVSQNLPLGKLNSEHDEVAKSQISVTGPKNAKLIFIKDKSLYGRLSNKAVSMVPMVPVVPMVSVVPNVENSKQNELTKLKSTSTQNAIVLQDNQKTMTKAKEKSFINILKYRKNYQIFTSHNHMYRKGRVQPWQITNKIAERLLSNLLFSVLSEINLNEIVEQIYKAEFE